LLGRGRADSDEVIRIARAARYVTRGGRILDQLMLVMNHKENRWARELVIEETHFAGLPPLPTALLATLLRSNDFYPVDCSTNGDFCDLV